MACVLLKEEKICYETVYYTLYIYTDEKRTFLKGTWHLMG